MNVLFIHQNVPGQFGHLAARLAADPRNRVVFLTKSEGEAPRGVLGVRYARERQAGAGTHRWLRGVEEAVLNGEAAARAAVALARGGFVPDLVVAHPGWGEALYVKDVFPHARFIDYCEFFYRPRGADVGFDPNERIDAEVAARLRTRNAPLLLSLEAADRGVAPTAWQKSLHPAAWHDRIETIFDGIDADTARPDAGATFALPDGTMLRAGDPVVTYVARNLEPYRGFPSFLRAVPEILERFPAATVVIVGGDGLSYGAATPDGRSWRDTLVEEVRPDPSRVHFLGKIERRQYLRLLQVSAAHVYLTVPFVLSWSAFEALAAGCVFIGSATPPVEEVVRDGENGFLVDFFSPAQIAGRVVGALAAGRDLDALRRRARETVLGRYDLPTCLGQWTRLVAEVAGAPAPGTELLCA